jgi:hypothetical protein
MVQLTIVLLLSIRSLSPTASRKARRAPRRSIFQSFSTTRLLMKYRTLSVRSTLAKQKCSLSVVPP